MRAALTFKFVIAMVSVAIVWAISPAAAAPTASASVNFAPTFQTALARVNYYREQVGLPALRPDLKLSQADRARACYVVENHLATGGYAVGTKGRFNFLPYNLAMMSESPGNPCFNSASANIASQSVYLQARVMPDDGSAVVDGMMTRMEVLDLLNPQAVAMGMGGYCEPGNCVVVASYRLGLQQAEYVRFYHGGRTWNPALGPIPFTSARLKRPIEFPAPNTTVSGTKLTGGALEPLLKMCPGYLPPMGRAIILSLGQANEPQQPVKLTSYSLSSGGKTLDACGIDATDVKVPPRPEVTSTAGEKAVFRWWNSNRVPLMIRQAIWNYGAVLVLPREPLAPGRTYDVSMTADSNTYKWSFKVAPTGSGAAVAVSR